MRWLIVILAPLTVYWAFLTRTGFSQTDYGGSVVDYWIRAQTDHTPITGFCASACTVRLKHAVCVSADAELVFHQATKPLGTRILLSTYSPSLRQWFSRTCDDGRLHLLFGSQLAAFGYRVCP
jgi:hypothetical protein